LLAKNVPKGEPEKGESESPTRDATPRPAPPKAIREVQALLDDGEADTFETYLESASDDAYRAFCDKAAAIPDLEARVAWARELVAAYKRLQNAQTVNESPANEPTRTPSNEITVPPALIPALVQLAAEEKQILQQLLGVLDRATTERAIAELSALQAVARIRRIIDEAKRRSASVAQRAFASGLRSEDNSGSTNGGAA
jgi:hypothetical protein